MSNLSEMFVLFCFIMVFKFAPLRNNHHAKEVCQSKFHYGTVYWCEWCLLCHGNGWQVLVTMHGSDDYEFVTVEKFGFAFSYKPNTHKGDHQTLVFVGTAMCAG